MWKRATWDDSVERAKYFDLVLDTGETAQARNIGARIPYPEKAEIIPPMLLCDESELVYAPNVLLRGVSSLPLRVS